MSAGMLRNLITIEQLAGSPSSNGDTNLRSWSTLETTWASITALSGAEEKEGREQTGVIYKIVVRYRSDITTKMRINHNSTLYEILDLFDKTGRRKYLEIRAKVVNA